MAPNKKASMDICNEDQISNLPDAVLCHILSFLQTKLSVRTSILSTRWRYLFTFVPILDFYYFHDPTIPISPANSSTNFVDFVNSVLLFYNVSCMKTFRLTFCHDRNHPKFFPISSWVSSVIRRNVQKLEIAVFNSVTITLPTDIFSCRMLVTLNLDGKFRVVLPNSVCLPCLRTCELFRLCFGKDSARRLFRSCPSLENLELYRCHLEDNVEVLDISVPTLKRLTMDFTNESLANYKLVLHVSSLLYFDYTGPLAYEFIGLGSLKSVVHASITYRATADTRRSVVAELVRSISHVQYLELQDKVEDLLCSGHSLPIFNNLTHLMFGPTSSFSSRLLPDLLDKTPRLEFLSLHEGPCDGHNGADENIYFSPEHIPTCVSLHLKEVAMCFTGLIYERQLIKYFLEYAKNLKGIKLRTELSLDEQFDISSPSCQVVFDSDDDVEDDWDIPV